VADGLPQGAAPTDAEDTGGALLDDPRDEVAGRLADLRGDLVGIGRARDDHCVLEAEFGDERAFEPDAALQAGVDRDIHQPVAAGLGQKPVDAKPGHLQPFRDLGLGQALDIVEPGGSNLRLRFLRHCGILMRAAGDPRHGAVQRFCHLTLLV
jgi:hypothetical protein